MSNEKNCFNDLSCIRSILFTPADKPALVTKASHGHADAVCLDLEDSIPLIVKPAARMHISSCVDELISNRKSAWVRVNSEAELISHDLDVIPQSCSVILLPKTRSIDHVELLCEAIDRKFPFSSRGPSVVAMIESTSALQSLSVNQSTQVNPRWVGLSIGTEDLASELDCDPDSSMIAHAFNQLVLCSRRLKLPLFGYPASIAQFTDIKLFSSGVEAGNAAGAAGGFCIHPAQVDTLNRVFAPTLAQINWATAVVTAFDKSTEHGSIAVDGKMVDRPIYLRAQRTLRLAKKRSSTAVIRSIKTEAGVNVSN